MDDARRRLKDAEVDFEQLTQLYEERELSTSTENILIEREQFKISEIKKAICAVLRKNWLFTRRLKNPRIRFQKSWLGKSKRQN